MAKRQTSSKKTKKESTPLAVSSGIEEVISNVRPSKRLYMLYGVHGLLVSGLPSILYTSPIFPVETDEGGPKFTLVNICAGAMMAKAYNSIARNKFSALAQQHDTFTRGKGRSGMEKSMLRLRQGMWAESAAYALFVCSVLFLFGFLSIAFAIVPAMHPNAAPELNHFLAVLSPAILLCPGKKKLVTKAIELVISGLGQGRRGEAKEEVVSGSAITMVVPRIMSR
ncbi:unnamed protein product [Chrysoparadoxa australica]